jgi:hypothetical protein
MNSRFLRFARSRSCALAAVIIATLPVTAVAQSTSLPPAKELIAKYVAATGGDAMAKHTSIRTHGQMTMGGSGVQGDLEVVQARPNKIATRITIAGVGEVLQGFDGTHGWSVNPMQGPRLLEGKELEQVRDDADFSNALRQSANITSSETVEKTTMGGQPCYKVKLVWKSGRETFDCYSVETSLLVGTLQKIESPMGTMETQTLQSEYKDFGGRKLATKMTQSMMGQEQVLTITSVEFDKVDATTFDPPPAIKTLIDKKP